MNYRHVFHAGNFADVLKHAVMARILVYLRTKPAAFRMIDTHAGAGRYDLTGPEAARGGEWRDGIGRLVDAPLPEPARTLLAPYLDAVAALNPHGLTQYPGSPLIAQSLLRPQDRLVACELEPSAFTELAAALRRDRRAKAIALDGWTALNAYVPPKERRGLVLIDPPFEANDEFARLSRALVAAHAKWPGGTYLAWYPIKRRTEPDMLAGDIASAGIGDVLRVELSRRAPAIGERLDSCGLVIVNPPWTLADELALLLPILTQRLAGPGGSYRVVPPTIEK